MNLADWFAVDRGRCAALARRTGVSAPFLSQIANGVRPCPATKVARIVAGTEQAVREWNLRPKDWHELWPQLIGADGAPPVPEPAVAPVGTAAATIEPDDQVSEASPMAMLGYAREQQIPVEHDRRRADERDGPCAAREPRGARYVD